MTLPTGTKLGAYEILSPLGAGGMGEVYRARDTRLDRAVAIKVLPAHLASQQELRDRFEREARVVSGLNHPNICTLYDIGRQDEIDFLVMEYLEGETLATRLKKGPLPLDQAMSVAIEIADALDKAHRKGVTHRDLKPGNVMLTKAGAKLLDFGLAKLTPGQDVLQGSKLPTADFSKELTAEGTILGTLQYMSPEQLEGIDADSRSDIFSFGVVLYEMLTGRKAFEGRSQSSVIAAIMHVTPPDVSTLQPLTPPAIDRVVRICLAKDPSDRWQTAHDLALQLQWIAEGGSQVGIPVPVAARRRHRERLAWTLFGLAVLLAAGIAVPATTHLLENTEEPAVRFEIQTPPMNNPFQVSISPDGKKVAFVASPVPGMNLLYVRPIDSSNAQDLPGTEGAIHPFWSPDGKSIGFGVLGSKLKRVELSGGQPQSICDLGGTYNGGTWNSDGVVVFGGTSGLLYRVSASGGIPQPISKLNGEAGETGRGWPRFLPDGRHYLYLSWSVKAENRAIYVGELDSPEVTRLFPSESMAVFAPPNSILFNREGTLLSQRVDPKQLTLQGEPVRIAEDIPFNGTNGRAAFDVSARTIVYRSDAGGASQKLNLTWVDRSGKTLNVIGIPHGYQGPDISPDGKRIAIHRHEGKGGDVWIIETPGGKATRLTFDASQENGQPVWSPTGSHIAFGSLRNGKWGIYQKPSNGVGNEELLFESDVVKMPISWSSNLLLFYVSDPKTNNDVWALPMNGERKASAVFQTPFGESHPQISPDGKWIAYFSNESGQPEVYVQSYPPGAGKWQVSMDGGVFPRWRADGKELFFMGSFSFGKMMVATVKTVGNSFESLTPAALFDTLYNNNAIRSHTGNWNTFAVSADGQRFLIPRPESSTTPGRVIPVTVVVNWTSAINR